MKIVRDTRSRRRLFVQVVFVLALVSALLLNEEFRRAVGGGVGVVLLYSIALIGSMAGVYFFVAATRPLVFPVWSTLGVLLSATLVAVEVQVYAARQGWLPRPNWIVL